jgi:hypothetical protein
MSGQLADAARRAQARARGSRTVGAGISGYRELPYPAPSAPAQTADVN